MTVGTAVDQIGGRLVLPSVYPRKAALLGSVSHSLSKLLSLVLIPVLNYPDKGGSLLWCRGREFAITGTGI